MKKLMTILFLLTAFILSSCSCLLSQIPPQIIYFDASCQAILPGYLNQVQVSGGCTGFVLTQTPDSGMIITDPSTNVTIKAVGSNNLSSEMSFIVMALDTVTPTIIFTGLPIAEQQEMYLNQIQKVYNQADKLVEQHDRWFSNIFPWDSFPGTKEVIDSSFYKQMLVVISLDSANTNIRKRMYSYADTVVLKSSNSIIYADTVVLK